VQVLHPPQKFEFPPFWNGWRYGIKKYGFEVTFSTSLLYFIKIYQLVQKLLGGKHRQTNRQTDRQIGDLISITFLFKEGRLKWVDIKINQWNLGKTGVGVSIAFQLVKSVE
jgi:hypothetical protein